MRNHRVSLPLLAFLLALGAVALILFTAQASALPRAPELDRGIPEPAEPPEGQPSTERLPALTVYSFTNVANWPIPDAFCWMQHEINVLDVSLGKDAYIYNLRVGVVFDHPYRGDLDIQIAAPNFITESLIAPNASGAKNYDVQFDLYSQNPPGGPPGEGDHDLALPHYEYTWHPMGDLSAFYQMPADGSWTLLFCDNSSTFNSDPGQLIQWTLWLEVGPPIVDLTRSYKAAPLKIGRYENITYTIGIKNIGALTLTNAYLNDVIPWGASYVPNSVQCSNGLCGYDAASPGGPAIFWNGGNLDPGATAAITFGLQAQNLGDVINQAQLTGNELAEPFWLLAHTTVYPEIIQAMDFEADDGGLMPASGDWAWGTPFNGPPPFNRSKNVWGTNLAGNYAPGVTHALILPLNLSGINSPTGLRLQFWEWYRIDVLDQGALLINGSPLYTFTGASFDWVHREVDLTAYMGQSTVLLKWQLTANADSITDLGWYIDNIALHPAMPQADLRIHKAADQNLILLGQPLAYTVTVHNLGPDPATNVHIVDTLPDGAILSDYWPGLAAATCETPSAGMVDCSIESLAVGEALALFVQLTPTLATSSDSFGDWVINHANTYADEPDPDLSNNAITLASAVLGVPGTALQLYGVTPEAAVIPRLGQLIRIDGENFLIGRDKMAVTLANSSGSYVLSGVVGVTSRRLEAYVPQSTPPGSYDVILLDLYSGQSARLLQAFTVLSDLPPSLTGIVPQRGLSDVPVPVTIRGENFSPGMSAALQANSIAYPLENVTFLGSDWLGATIPPGIPPGIYELNVLDASENTATLAGAYSVLDPALFDDLFSVDELGLWSIPPYLQAGQPITLGLTILRQGGSDPLENVPADFYLNLPVDLPPGTRIARAVAESIAPRSGVAVTVPWQAPFRPGDYTLRAQIDPEDQVAEADESNNWISRTVRVLPATLSTSPFQIESFTINDGAPIARLSQVVLNLSASRPEAASHLSRNPLAIPPDFVLYIEYLFNQSENRWTPVANSGWLPYNTASAAYLWKLHPSPGVHYLQAWVADKQGFVSLAPGQASINLMFPLAHVAAQEAHIYRFNLLPGDSALVRLTSFSGDADLYLWDPLGNDMGRSESDAPVEELLLTAALTGTYQIEVEGFTSADYGLEIIAQTTTLTRDSQTWIASPLPRGRVRPLSGEIPGETIVLPDVPIEAGERLILLPILLR